MGEGKTFARSGCQLDAEQQEQRSQGKPAQQEVPRRADTPHVHKPREFLRELHKIRLKKQNTMSWFTMASCSLFLALCMWLPYAEAFASPTSGMRLRMRPSTCPRVASAIPLSAVMMKVTAGANNLKPARPLAGED